MASSSTPNAPEVPVQSNKETELAVRTKFQNTIIYPHANTISSVAPRDIPGLRQDFQLPGEYGMRAPETGERMYWRPTSVQVGVPLQIMKYGVRFPLHVFISDFLEYVGIGLAQLVPNSYIHLVCFIAACKKFGIKPSMDYFFHIFSLTKTKEQGFRSLNRLPGQRTWMNLPTSNKGWHSNWVFISGLDLPLLPLWADPERPQVDPLEDVRKDEFKGLCDAIPQEPWDIRWLTNQQWLHDHGLLAIRTDVGHTVQAIPSSQSPSGQITSHPSSSSSQADPMGRSRPHSSSPSPQADPIGRSRSHSSPPSSQADPVGQSRPPPSSLPPQTDLTGQI